MSNSHHKKTVYIIEDDLDILSLVSMLLKAHHFETIMDLNGNNFDVKRLPCPDLYIIDMNLIDKNGADICVEIKKECPDVPVLIMSAYVKLDEIITEINADKYIQKPFSLSELVDSVSSLLHKN